MKIPVLPMAQGAPQGLASSSPALIQAEPAFGRAIQQLGQQVGEVAGVELGKAHAEAQKAVELADATRITERLTDYEHFTTSNMVGNAEDAKAPPGFLSSKGEEAHALSAATLDALEKERQRLAEDLNPRQKAEFLRRSAGMFEDTRRQVEGHVAQQFKVAQQQASKDQDATYLNSIANNANQPEKVRQLVEDRITTLRKLGAGEAEVLDWKARAAKVQIGQFLASRNVAGAEAVFKATAESLGPDAGPVAEKIAAVKQGVEKEAEAAQDERHVENLSNIHRNLDGFADVQAMQKDLDKVPEERRAGVRRLLDKRIADEEGLKKETIDGWKNDYYRAVAQGQRPDAGLRERLLKYDAKFILGMDRQDEEHQRARLAHARGQSARETPDQQRAMTEFLVDVADHPDKYATMAPGEMIATWAPRLSPRDLDRAGQVLAGAHGKATKPTDLTPLETKVLIQTGREAGLFDKKQGDVSKWGDEQADAYYQLVKDIQQKSADFKRANGKAPPLDQVEKWASERLLQGTVPGTGVGGYFQTKTTRLQAEMGGTGFEPKWSPKQLDEAKRALERGGLAPTDALLDTYLRRKHGLPAAPAQAPAPPTDAELEDQLAPPPEQPRVAEPQFSPLEKR